MRDGRVTFADFLSGRTADPVITKVLLERFNVEAMQMLDRRVFSRGEKGPTSLNGVNFDFLTHIGAEMLRQRPNSFD